MNVFLIYGDEKFLINSFIKNTKKEILKDDNNLILMNYHEFNGNKCNVIDIESAINTISFTLDDRLILIKDSGLLSAGRSNDTTYISQVIKDIPTTDNTTIIFSEKDVDKRSKLYKQLKVQNNCEIIEFVHKDEKSLIKFVQDTLKPVSKKMETNDIVYLIKTVSNDMTLINNELNKLISYKNDEVITKEDIDLICTKSLDAQVFNLMSYVSQKKSSNAVISYNDMLTKKESPIMILTLLARQFRILFQVKILLKKLDKNSIAKKIGVSPYFINDYINQTKNFETIELYNAIKEVLELDISIKTGQTPEDLGVLLLILKYSS